VVGVTSVEGRHGTTTVVVSFNQALDPTSAQNAANYELSLPGRAVHTRSGHSTATRPGRSLVIKAASYNAAGRQVTLTLGQSLRRNQPYQFQINGASGGVKGTNGTALNSPDTLKPGKDYEAVLELAARRS
jgi:hypothetical protein